MIACGVKFGEHMIASASASAIAPASCGLRDRINSAFLITIDVRPYGFEFASIGTSEFSRYSFENSPSTLINLKGFKRMKAATFSNHLRVGLLHGLLIATVVLTGCGGGDVKPAPITVSEGPILKDGKTDSRLVGAWRVLGTGQLLEIGEKTVQTFEETQTLCYPQTDASDVSETFEFGSTFRLSGIAEIFEPPSKLPSTWLERIERIPANCKLTPATDPATTFKAFWEIIALDYAFLKERSIDWVARYAQFAPKAAAAATDDELQAVLIEAVQDFNDVHTQVIRITNRANREFESVFDASDTPTIRMVKKAFTEQTEIADFFEFLQLWKQEVHKNFASALSEGSQGRVLNGAMVWGKLPGNIGYIEIDRMANYVDQATTVKDIAAIGAELDRALTALAGTKALIVDVAINDGGTDLVSAEIASRFADQRRLAFTKRSYRDHPKRPTQSWYVEPSTRVKYQRPVYLLSSDLTVSAGDIFTLMMREFPNVTHVGQATSGSLSDALLKTLPGNFAMTISNEIYLDPRGNLYEAKGIPPKLAITLLDPNQPESLSTGHAQAIATLLKQIQ
jgi:carboxyl-terminal processing protease